MKKKKILWLCSWYPSRWEPFNGDFIQRHAHAAALYNDIHVIHVAYDLPVMKEVPDQEIKTGNNLTEHIVYFKRNRSILAKFVNHFRVQSVFKRAIRNYIIKNGKPDLVHVQVPMKAGLLGLWVKKNYKVPFLITEHWGIYNDIIEKGYSKHGFAFRQLSKRIFRNAFRLISVSKYLAEGVNRLVGSIEYEVIPNVVNTDLFFYQERENSVFRFVHVSNMVPLKNVQGILRSFKQLLNVTNQIELILAGDTDVKIREYASSLNIPSEKLTFKGEITYPEVAIEMQKANCFILFSNIENSPCVIGESLCCGVPVIATNVGGIPELIDESNGLLIDAQDENALTNAMKKMIKEIDKYDSKKIAESAKNKFSYSSIGKSFDSVYKEMPIPENRS